MCNIVTDVELCIDIVEVFDNFRHAQAIPLMQCSSAFPIWQYTKIQFSM
jgi:hypothetical protein